ncbi:hypothetical protein M758_8G102800 [Ceratodon purpureus]|nr:hypothetical protein M758_8G102800 [Ceratodon purpureus]
MAEMSLRHKMIVILMFGVSLRTFEIRQLVAYVYCESSSRECWVSSGKCHRS